MTAPLWARHVAARLWCIVDDINASVVTACRGRWDADDEYTISADPPENERCGGCELERMRQNNRGLAQSVERPRPKRKDAGSSPAASATILEGGGSGRRGPDDGLPNNSAPDECSSLSPSRSVGLAGSNPAPRTDGFQRALEQFAIDCAESEQDFIRRLGETLYRSSEPEPTVIEVDQLEDV